MFGKKKEVEKTEPFPIEVLTTEYHIEGIAPGDLQFMIPTGTEYWYPIELTNAKISAVGTDGIPARTADRFEVKGDAVVAMIPRKDPGAMPQYASYLAFKNALKGIFYIGPYLFEGTLMSVGSDRFNSALLMLDTTIRHASPKSKFAEISAPHVLVHTRWMHGREVK